MIENIFEGITFLLYFHFWRYNIWVNYKKRNYLAWLLDIHKRGMTNYQETILKVTEVKFINFNKKWAM